MTRQCISVAALMLSGLSCSTFGPDYLTGGVANYGAVTVFVFTSNVSVPPRGADSIAVALDSAIQGAYVQRFCGEPTSHCASGTQVVDTIKFKAVLGGIHETTLRGSRSSCSIQSRTSSDTTTMVGIDRKFIVDNGYQIVVTYLLTCPPPP